MSGLDDRIREGLERLARPADGSDIIEDVARRRRRLRVVRRARTATLALAVVAGSAAGVWGLSRAFDFDRQTQPGVSGGRNGLIAFSAKTEENDWDILVVNPDGSGLRPLVAGPHGEIHPVWSPDGKRLAYITQRERTASLQIVEADGSDRDKVFGAPGPLFRPAWSPDGSRIAIASASGQLLILELARSTYIAQSLGIPILGAPAWSPDANHLAFAGGQEEPMSYEEQAQIYTWDVERRKLMRVTDMTGAPTDPVWSPDGSRIAFINEWVGEGCPSMASELGPDDPFFGLHVVDVQTQVTTRLIARACHGPPAWSPDASRVALVGGEEPASVVIVMDVDSPEDPLMGIKVEGEAPSIAWSPDGRLIAFSAGDSIRVAPIGRSASEIVSGIGTLGDIAWQPVTAPVAGPTVGAPTSPSADPIGCPTDGDPLPGSYRPSDPQIEEDAGGLGEGRLARPRIYEDDARPLRCRYLLVVPAPDGDILYSAVPEARWLPGLPGAPTVLMSAEIDGQPGQEVVVAFGGPGHPHRTGVVFTLEGERLRAMRVAGARVSIYPTAAVPLSGEFAVGIDCAGEPGTIVTTSGAFASGGDLHYDITRTFHRARGTVFEEIDRETFTVDVGTEGERWPETADDPFRSCPR